MALTTSEGVGLATDQEFDDVMAQCEIISSKTGVLIIGSVGRLAVYGDGREFTARGEGSLLLRNDGSLRDLDVLAPSVDTVLPEGVMPIDSSMKRSLVISCEDGDWQIYDRRLDITVGLRPEPFEPLEVSRCGRTINVMRPQTMAMLYQVYGLPPRKQDVIAKLQLDEFLAKHSDGRLPDELYAEFINFISVRNSNGLFKAQRAYHTLMPNRLQQVFSPAVRVMTSRIGGS